MNESLKWIILSVFFIILGMYIIIKKARCKTEVEAVLIRKERRRASRRGHYYCGTFSFEYEGQSYTADVNLGIDKELTNIYMLKAKYKIYINPKRPKIAFIKDKLEAEDFLALFIGMLALFVYLFK